MKKIAFTFVMTFLLGISFTWASVQSDIENANKAGNAVFLVVTDPGVAGTDKAMETARLAHEKYAQSVVISMNRSDAENAEFITKYRLATAQLPLILIIATNGIVSAGLIADKATPELIVKAIPSPKKADVQKILSEGKSVFIVVTSKTMAQKDNIMNTCQQACIEMNNNAKMLEIDLNDSREQQFLTELKVNMTATEPMTYVINAKGQITGTFNDDVNSTTLVATAKKVSAGCCPAGSGKTCK